MFGEWLVPQLQQAGIRDIAVLQMDGTPQDHSRVVTERGSEASPAPFGWPPRSPDLTTPDNVLWGFIKERLSKMWYRTTEVSRTAVEEAFTHMTPDYLCKTSARTRCRIQLCYDNERLHTDVLNF
jgi:hypothetical protein